MEINRCFLLSALLVFLLLLIPTECELHKRQSYSNETNNNINAAPAVQLIVRPNQVELFNGMARVTFSKPGGLIIGIQYNGISNLLANAAGGYWDCVWQSSKGGGRVDKLLGTQFKVISQTPDQVEISFSRTANKASPFPLKIDKRFIMLRGKSGFYSYGIYEHLQGWPWLHINELRIVFKLKESNFRYIAVSDQRQKVMPTGYERSQGKVLSYPEAVRLRNGEVDDKYQYTSDNKDNHLHGWISDNPGTGFWMITPSDEFRSGGPFRQDLTSHTASTTLSMFVSSHYFGPSGIHLKDGEPWKKVFGPVFVYLNSDKTAQHRQVLWKNAKSQMYSEMNSWPYSFPGSADYLKANQRGSVSGLLQVKDSYKTPQPGVFANVGLAPPGAPGSWETDYKGYQFWTRADNEGNFVIKNVRPGTYNLYAWVPAYIGNYRYSSPVVIKSGGVVNLNKLVYSPPRYGPSLWHIGYPNRDASEFYIPDVNPYYVNKLYLNFDKFRQYGLWDRYTDLYPKGDLTFTIGKSNYSRDWFYAHVPRRTKNGKYVQTTWTIVFEMKTVEKNKDYLLRFAFAAANYGKLRIGVNNRPVPPTIGPLGKDNSIARHGIHGLYHLAEHKIWYTHLKVGRNTIQLTHAPEGAPFSGFMYDYIRFETPPVKRASSKNTSHLLY